MNCPKCNQSLEQDDKFCFKCGSAIKSKPQKVEQNSEKIKKDSEKAKIFTIINACACAFFCFVGFKEASVGDGFYIAIFTFPATIPLAAVAFGFAKKSETFRLKILIINIILVILPLQMSDLSRFVEDKFGTQKKQEQQQEIQTKEKPRENQVARPVPIKSDSQNNPKTDQGCDQKYRAVIEERIESQMAENKKYCDEEFGNQAQECKNAQEGSIEKIMFSEKSSACVSVVSHYGFEGASFKVYNEETDLEIDSYSPSYHSLEKVIGEHK